MNPYYTSLNEIERYIHKLKSESFEGWTEDEIKGYLTACESIEQKVRVIKTSNKLDGKDE